jgi:D-amino-acid dehydrogenase
VDKSDLTDGCSFGNAGMIVPSHFIPLASPGIISKGIQWMFKRESPFYIRPRLDTALLRWLWLFYKSSNSKHVAESATLLRDMHIESRELYKHLNQTPGFHFNFEQKGILMLYNSSAAEKDELETAEVAHQLGIEAIPLSPDQLKMVEPGIQFSVRGAVHYPGDAHITPHLWMNQMVHFLHQNGVEIKSNAEVVGIADQGESGCELLFRDGSNIKARQVVVAAGSWSGKLMKKQGFVLPMQDGKGYSMTLHQQELKPVIPSILHEARVAITPMGHDLRITGTLEISGMDDKINPYKVKSILQAVPQYYPELKIINPGPIWYGYRPCSPDGLPYIGRWKPGSSVIVATGHAMMGLSLAPVTGRMVKNIVLDASENTLSSKLKPDRFA